MTLCYKVLLIIDGVGSEGTIQWRDLAERFQRFFRQRKVSGKAEDKANRFRQGETE